MALGNLNIGIPLVASTIGVDTDHLGVLVASAASGGTNSYIAKYAAYLTLAFYLDENKAAHAGRNDGYLIPGAQPFWNMWSNKIPARWFCDAGNNFSLNLRLPRNAENTNGGYDFILHDFRGYEHNKNVHEKPLLMLGNLTIWEGQTIDVTARFDKKQLDLSAASRSGGAITHYLLRFTINTTDHISNIIPIDNSGTDVPTVQLSPAASTQITITPFLLPANVDSGRVMVPAQFYESDAAGGSNVITVTVNAWPRLGVDSMAIYEQPVNLSMVLDETWTWGNYPPSEGIAVLEDSAGNVIDDFVVNSSGALGPLNQTMYIRFYGNVSGSRTMTLYRNGVAIGTPSTQTVQASPNNIGIRKSVNFQATGFGLNVGDYFEIIVT